MIDNLLGETYPQECKSVQVCSNDLLPQLKRRLKEHQERVDNLNAAITALESNPEIARVLELVSRVR